MDSNQQKKKRYQLFEKYLGQVITGILTGITAGIIANVIFYYVF